MMFCIFSLISLLMIAAISHIFQCENFFELLLQNAYIILKFVRMTGIITKKLAINVRRYESKLHELNWEAKINKIWNKGNGNNISKYHQVWSESFGKKLLINGVRWKFIKIKKCGKWHQYDNNQIWQKIHITTTFHCDGGENPCINCVQNSWKIQEHWKWGKRPPKAIRNMVC